MLASSSDRLKPDDSVLPDGEDEILSHAKTDMSAAIDKLAQAAFDRTRTRLQDNLSAAPHVVVSRLVERKPKSVFQVKQEQPRMETSDTRLST
jgi:hypothetical protein